MKPIHATAVAVLSAAATLVPASAAAQSADAWQFDAALYLYLPSVGGTTRFGSGGDSDATVDVSKLLESLNTTFQGTFEARRGQWGAYTDFFYVDFGKNRAATRDLSIGGIPLPADVSAATDFSLKGTSWTVAGVWRAIPDPASPLDVLFGARLLDIKESLAWQLSGNIGQFPVTGQARQQEASLHNVDAILGAKGRVAFGNGGGWYVPYYVDVGTGDSKFTWQAMSGIGYSFGALSVVAGWRYLDYKMKSGKPFETLNFSGPTFAAVFRW
jgi:hypothetical protein